MIDLNDVGTPKARHDLAAVKDRLAATAGDWLPGIFPEARIARDRRSLRCADLSGRPPRKEGSCTIHLDGPYAGWGFDYATGESAGPIDLIAQATGLCDGALFDEAARIAGMDHPAPRNAPRAKPDHTGEIARLVDGARTRTVGRVSMDMLTVDLTPVPQATTGSVVTLWGQAANASVLSIDEVAACAQTVGYELMCGLAQRVPVEVAP